MNKITGFQKKLIIGVGIFTLLIVWIVFPLIFKQLIDAYKVSPQIKDYGAFGDIYGSLNTLISSIALSAVAYSTYLQIQSLKETRESNEKQLKLSQKMHDEQIKESEYATFSNAFYALLNYKKEKLNSIELESCDGNKIYKGLAALQKLSNVFHTEIMVYHSISYSDFSRAELEKDFYKECHKIFKISGSPLISYFYVYQDLIWLIKDSTLDEINKQTYQRILSNSMYQEEQIVLFWISPIFKFDVFLQDSELFSQIGLIKQYKPYALKHHNETHFGNVEWKTFFSSKDQDPA